MTDVALTGRVWRTRSFSLRLSQRVIAVDIALAAVLVALSLWSIAAGDFPLALGDVVKALIGQGDEASAFIVTTLRLPRLLTGLLTGISLGVSGAMFQSLARNPLASPDVIGFDSGAALGAVACVILFGATGGLVAIGGIGGGLITAILVLALSWRAGLTPLRVVLVGIGVGVFAYAGVDFLLTRSDIFEASAAQAWLTGSLNARLSVHVLIAGLGVALCTAVVLLIRGALERIELGDDLAAGLGISVNRTRIVAGLAGVLLAALAVAAAGPLAFVALVAAPIARRISGASLPLITAGLVGAVIVTGGDLAGRLAFAPTQLPAGVFTAVLGAPYLLWLLATQIRKGAM